MVELSEFQDLEYVEDVLGGEPEATSPLDAKPLVRTGKWGEGGFTFSQS
jgi:hypothetical protein